MGIKKTLIEFDDAPVDFEEELFYNLVEGHEFDLYVEDRVEFEKDALKDNDILALYFTGRGRYPRPEAHETFKYKAYLHKRSNPFEKCDDNLVGMQGGQVINLIPNKSSKHIGEKTITVEFTTIEKSLENIIYNIIKTFSEHNLSELVVLRPQTTWGYGLTKRTNTFQVLAYLPDDDSIEAFEDLYNALNRSYQELPRFARDLGYIKIK